ncbi:MAG: hypothetical protein WB783_17615 [Arenicellales bacterium]
MSVNESKAGPDNGARQYANAWRRAGPELERERLRALRRLSEAEAAKRFALLLRLPGPYPLRPSSGLVEQQRIFSRLRSKDR